MAEQVGTPGSTADSSLNNANKAPATKDKQCPFCNQPFTSSSLGRHLDLYIKEKNPKAADGVHDVDQIRKMRGGITRRQPRNSLAHSRREGSTPNGTPGANNSNSSRRSPVSDSGRARSIRTEQRSPVVGRYVPDEVPKGGLVAGFFDRPSWHATGVINDIPSVVNNTARAQDEEQRDRERTTGSHKTVSKQLLTKSIFEQKQKVTEALDTARAAELALREIIGSIRAAT